MKILFISGDGDFDAMAFEQVYPNIDKAIEKFFPEGHNGTATVTFKDKYEEEYEYTVRLSIKEFGSVDEKFIDWIVDEYVDYDLTKAKNFHILREES